MTKQNQTVTGTVSQVTEWKSKKGSWINLEGNPNDFFAYKGKVPTSGVTGTWEVKEGKGFRSLFSGLYYNLPRG